MFDRIANSFELARSSWSVLRQDKQLILFPILSSLGGLLVLLGFAAPFVAVPQLLDFLERGDGAPTPPWVFLVVFAYYFCNYFVIVFCNAALVSCALIRFNGGEPTVADGLGAAASRLPQILAWALVSATVGVLLRMVENAHEKAGAIISALLGTAWTIMTFFVVPVLVVEKLGPIAAVKRSLAILRRTWGEALVGRMGISLFLFVLTLPGILAGMLGAFLCTKVVAAGLAVIALAVVYILVLAAVGAALQGIFLAALYQYAGHGRVPSGFDEAVLQQAFMPKK